jgi:hypothetical protein
LRRNNRKNEGSPNTPIRAILSDVPKKPGRPSKFTPELSNKICELTATAHSLEQICQKLKLHHSTIAKWQAENPEFSADYARAREAQGDYMDSKVLTEAQNCTNENYLATRVRIDAYKWRAAHLRPKVYGDKTQIDANVTMSWASIVEEVAAKRLAEAKTIEGEIVDETEKKGL